MAMIVSGALFFYLGARFGAKINRATDTALAGSLLPDEKLDLEIQRMIAEGRQDLRFHQLLQGDMPPANLVKNENDEAGFDRDALIKKHEEVSKQELKESENDDKTDKNGTDDKAIKKDIKEKVAEKKTEEESKKKLPEKSVATENKTQALIDEVVPESTFPNQPEVVVNKTRYRLQIGSYSDEKKAQAEVSLWQKRGFSTNLVKTQIAGKGAWFRLQLGNYANMDEVKKAQAEVMAKFGKSPAIATLPASE